MVVLGKKEATSGGVSGAPDSGAVGRGPSCTATVTDSTPTSASAPSGTVSWSASSVPPGGGSFSASSCSLGGASTDPVTGAVSTSCAVSYTPAVVGAPRSSGSYSGDTRHRSSAGSFVVTANKHATSTVVSFLFNDTAATEIYTLSLHDALPISTSASAPSGTVSWSASSVPPGGGSFSASSCSLGGASTDPVTGDLKTTRPDSRHPRMSEADIIFSNDTDDTTHLSRPALFMVIAH